MQRRTLPGRPVASEARMKAAQQKRREDALSRQARCVACLRRAALRFPVAAARVAWRARLCAASDARLLNALQREARHDVLARTRRLVADALAERPGAAAAGGAHPAEADAPTDAAPLPGAAAAEGAAEDEEMAAPPAARRRGGGRARQPPPQQLMLPEWCVAPRAFAKLRAF